MSKKSIFKAGIITALILMSLFIKYPFLVGIKTIDEPYVYPYNDILGNKVQGEEWRSLTQEEKIKARTVPSQILYSMTPKALAGTILNYPNSLSVLLWDNMEDGYERISNREEFQLAYSTAGVAQEIMMIYQQPASEYMKDIEHNYAYISHLSFTMAQWVILDQLTEVELHSLVEIARKKMVVAKENEGMNAINGGDELVLLRALERLYGFEGMQNHLQVEGQELILDNVRSFIDTGNILYIYREVKNP